MPGGQPRLLSALPVSWLSALMRDCIHLRAGLFVFSIYERVWEASERIAAHPFLLLCAELLIEFKEFNHSFKLRKK